MAVTSARLVAFVIGIGGLLLVAAPGAHGAVIVQTMGTPVGAQPGEQQTGRVERGGTNYVCDGPLAFEPESEMTGSQFAYTDHVSSSRINERVCLTVTLNTTCAGVNQIHSVSYV